MGEKQGLKPPPQRRKMPAQQMLPAETLMLPQALLGFLLVWVAAGAKWMLLPRHSLETPTWMLPQALLELLLALVSRRQMRGRRRLLILLTRRHDVGSSEQSRF